MNRHIKIFLCLAACFFYYLNASSQTANTKHATVTIEDIEYLNSDGLDFSPTFYREGIVFVSSRNKDRKVDDKINEPFFDLFFADLGNSGTPGPPQQFSLKINSEYHEGPVSFNRAGDKIFFTRNNLNEKGKPIPSSEGTVKMKIYEADKGASEWENIRELPFNSKEYSCIHPTLDANNKRLYFASDMPGG
ncbi:MAG: hypothetical protein AAF573_00360 [Bacteroidota bacterium]